MLEAIILALIYICILAIAVYLIFWVLENIGVSIPAHIQKIIWVIVVLIVLLILIRNVFPKAGIRLGGDITTYEQRSI